MPQKDQKTYQLNLTTIAFTFFIASRFIALFLAHIKSSDVAYYLNISEKIFFLDFIPYLDFSFEYPPLSLIAIYLPALISQIDSSAAYYIYFICMMFFIDYFSLKLTQNFCKKLQIPEKEIACVTIIYSLFGLMVFELLYYRLDLIVALFFLLSITVIENKKGQISPLNKSFFTTIITGFFYKIIPAINAPIAIFFSHFKNSKNNQEAIKKIIISTTIFAFLIIFIISLLQVTTNHNFIKNMLYHQDRDIQIESSFSSLLILKNLVFNEKIYFYLSHGALNIKASEPYIYLSKFFGNLILISFYLLVFCKLLKNSSKKIFTSHLLIEGTIVTIMIFLSFQRVLSPQFFIWLIPIVAIFIVKNNSKKLLLAFLALFFSTFIIFTVDYFALTAQNKTLLTVLILRNIFLILFTIILTKNFLKKLN